MDAINAIYGMIISDHGKKKTHSIRGWPRAISENDEAPNFAQPVRSSTRRLLSGRTWIVKSLVVISSLLTRQQLRSDRTECARAPKRKRRVQPLNAWSRVSIVRHAPAK